MGKLDRLSSACLNNVISALSGVTSTLNVPVELLRDTVLETRLAIIHKYALLNLLNTKDLYDSINCLELDCKSLDRCCYDDEDGELVAHTEIPLLAFVAGQDNVIRFIGTTDRSIQFDVYFDESFKYRKYKRYLKKKRPYVFIDPAVNENNMLDVFVFNAPLLERISITAIFKSWDLVEQFACCQESTEAIKDTFSDIDLEVQNLVVDTYIKYYRLLINPYPAVLTNNPGGTVPNMLTQL